MRHFADCFAYRTDRMTEVLCQHVIFRLRGDMDSHIAPAQRFAGTGNRADVIDDLAQ